MKEFERTFKSGNGVFFIPISIFIKYLLHH
jgi:hypothetical protein